MSAKVRPGTRVRWLGRLWRVEQVHKRPSGTIFRIRSEQDMSTEVISSDSSDGGFEVLGAA